MASSQEECTGCIQQKSGGRTARMHPHEAARWWSSAPAYAASGGCRETGCYVHLGRTDNEVVHQGPGPSVMVHIDERGSKSIKTWVLSIAVVAFTGAAAVTAWWSGGPSVGALRQLGHCRLLAQRLQRDLRLQRCIDLPCCPVFHRPLPLIRNGAFSNYALVLFSGSISVILLAGGDEGASGRSHPSSLSVVVE